MTTGIYQIRNKVNGKLYVGSTSISFAKRWRVHRTYLNLGRHANRHLQAAWNKYGEHAFAFEIIEHCAPDECLSREQYWLDSLNAADDRYGYNILPTAGSSRGRTYSTGQRLQMSLVRRGKTASAETKARMSAAHKARQTPELRKRQSEARRGKPHHTRWRTNLAAALRRPEVRAAALRAIIGRPVSEATRRKISASNKGKPVPHERRQRIAGALRTQKQTEETKAKRTATMGTTEFRERMRQIKLAQGSTDTLETKRRLSESTRRIWAERKRLALEAVA